MPIVVIEADLTAAGYTSAVCPRELGYRVPISAGFNGDYPSGGHWGQFIILEKSTGVADLVCVQDPDPAIQRWRITGSPRRLEIEFEGTVQPIVRAYGFASWRGAADRYADWALAQTWAQRRPGPSYNAVCPLTIADLTRATTQMLPVAQAIGARNLAFSTMYRTDASQVAINFDVGYPSFRAHPAYATLFQQFGAAGVGVLPYTNPVLFDTSAGLAAETGYNAAFAVRDGANAIVSYPKPNLVYACPARTGHADFVRLGPAGDNGWSQLAALPGVAGIYVDVALNAAPLICSATNHGHAANDPKAWISGVDALLASMAAVPYIAAEGASELAIRRCNAFYAWTFSDLDYIQQGGPAHGVHLLSHIWNSRVDIYGYEIKPPFGPVTPGQALAKIKRSWALGCRHYWDLPQDHFETLDDPANAAVLAEQLGYNQAYNILEGFEGDANALKQRTTINGWKHANLPWTN
jgi:hypothetical protein